MTKSELLSLFQIGASLSVSDKFHIHTASGRLLEVSAETVLAYLRRSTATFEVASDGEVSVAGVATGYKIEPVDLSNLTTRVEALEAEMAAGGGGGSCQCSEMGEHLEVPTDDTMIKVKDGDTMMHITMADIKNYLAEEYAPKWTDATVTVTCTKSGVSTLMEVGSARPASGDFNVTYTPAKAESAAGTATGGEPGIGGITGYVPTTVGGSIAPYSNTVTVNFDAGTDVVKTSKGNATNRTASNSTTVLASASVNSNIDADTFTIKAITKTVTYTITYVYALWANTASISSVAKLALSSATQVTLEFPAETASAKHTFDIPSAYALSKIEVLNTLSNKYETYATSSFTASDTTHEDAAGTSTGYKRYTRNDGTNGATTFRITFTR